MLKHAITAVLAVMLVALQWRLWVSDDGLRSRTKLREQLPVELPHPHPAALPDPERVLEGDQQAGEDVGKRFHSLCSW